MSEGLHPFFERLQPKEVTTTSFDEMIFKDDHRLKIVFMWGHDCPNCEVAKNVLADRTEEMKAIECDWFHTNVYDNMELSSRFGLHGIPVFFFFRNGQRLGKFTTFPGWEPFFEVVQKLLVSHS